MKKLAKGYKLRKKAVKITAKINSAIAFIAITGAFIGLLIDIVNR